MHHYHTCTVIVTHPVLACGVYVFVLLPLLYSDTSPEAESITIEAGSQFILPYSPVSSLVKDGDARLL